MRIRFKSNTINWKKEYSGLKRNTQREFASEESDDVRKEILDDYSNGKVNILEIEIENTTTGETFVRNVTDVTFWRNQYIISW